MLVPTYGIRYCKPIHCYLCRDGCCVKCSNVVECALLVCQPVLPSIHPSLHFFLEFFLNFCVELPLPSQQNSGEGLTGLGMMYYTCRIVNTDSPHQCLIVHIDRLQLYKVGLLFRLQPTLNLPPLLVQDHSVISLSSYEIMIPHLKHYQLRKTLNHREHCHLKTPKHMECHQLRKTQSHKTMTS